MAEIPKNVVILGASGYTGAELVRLLARHPHVRIAALTGDTQAGKPLSQIFPHLASLTLPDLVAINAVQWEGIDLVFCCLPHGTTQEVIAALPAHMRIIDLSADFRLRDPRTYAQWYGQAHKAPDLQKEAVYGLTEHARDAIRHARLVANPGCYPTAVQLPLVPLLKENLIAADSIIIDAKSGVTGAGRSAKQANLFAEVDGGIGVYGVGVHRHMPEIEQGLSDAAGKPLQVSFTPHLMPMARGILSTIYVTLTKGDTISYLRAALEQACGDEPFIHLAPEGVFPATHHVRGSNHCIINIFADRIPGRGIVVSVIDNLVKGASGQAVQNMNVMFGWPETLALEQLALFP